MPEVTDSVVSVMGPTLSCPPETAHSQRGVDAKRSTLPVNNRGEAKVPFALTTRMVRAFALSVSTRFPTCSIAVTFAAYCGAPTNDVLCATTGAAVTSR